MKITVLVPTYRRPQDLERCLSAIQQQTRAADEVLAIVRDTDDETHAFLKSFDPILPCLRIVTVTLSGVIAAIDAGFAAAAGELIAITDDDAAPHPDWLERIESNFQADPRVGGVGGRDRLYLGTQLVAGAAPVVGKLQWFGRMVGNHHIGVGSAREVDLLKGVNMSFRSSALAGLRCDERLKGTGAQVHFELALCLAVKQRGWKLIYDPAICVDHYPAQRFDEDERQGFSAIATANAVHNETSILLDRGSLLQRFIYICWSVLVGTRSAFGLVQLLRFLPQEGSLAIHKWQAAMQGRWQGWQTWHTTRADKSDRQESVS
jgi:cellulose synthase/poly-beta-1,6-N-acetylglucosamine synthase-like glycosyltransferase